MKIYMAGPLFTTAEKNFNSELAHDLRNLGYDVFLPQDQEQCISDLKAIFLSDKVGIDQADLVLGCLDGSDADSGTSWELGYGYARGKMIVVYRTDFRIGKDDPVNLMVTESAGRCVITPTPAIRELARLIHEEIVDLAEETRDRASATAPRYRHIDK